MIKKTIVAIILLFFIFSSFPSILSDDTLTDSFLITNNKDWVNCGFKNNTYPCYNNEALTDFYMPIAFKKTSVTSLKNSDVKYNIYNRNNNFDKRFNSLEYEILESSTYYVVLYHMRIKASNQTFSVDFVPKIKNVELKQYAWWNSSYNKYAVIHVNSSYLGSDLTNFPVSLKIPNSVGTDCNDGHSIRFIGTDNSTIYPYEIEDWNSTGVSHVWIEIPFIDGETGAEFLMYYSNPSVTDGQNIYGVWGANNYAYVNHFSGSSSALCIDSSGNNNSINTVYGAPIYSITGKIGNCTYLARSGDAFKILDSSILDLDESHTIEFVLQPRSSWNTNGNTYRMIWKAKWGLPYRGYMIQFDGDSDNLMSYSDAIANAYSSSNILGIPANVWYYFATVLNENVSGTSQENLTNIHNAQFGLKGYKNDEPLYISGSPSQSDCVDAYYDELRISNIVRNMDWRNASYNTSFADEYCIITQISIYFIPYSYPVNVTLINFVNNTNNFPLYFNNISLYAYAEDGASFNVSMLCSSKDLTVSPNTFNGSYMINFSYMLCSKKNYTLWCNFTKNSKNYNYIYEFCTVNISSMGLLDMENISFGVEVTQLFLVILLVLWTFFITKCIDDKDENKTVFGLIQFVLSFPLSIAISTFSFTFPFAYIVVFALPVVSLYILAFGYFEDKESKKRRKKYETKT